MNTAPRKDAYTTAQVSAITGLPRPAVHKAIEHRLLRPKRVHKGLASQRVLSKAQLVYLRMEATGLTSLPLATRRRVAQAVERDPEIDVMALSEGNVILINFKSARRDVAAGLRRLARASRMIASDAETMRGSPMYKGTRIPVEVVADMLSQGATVTEILEGYPALTREKVELAPLYLQAFPRRGRPAQRPWSRSEPERISEHPAGK